MNGSATNTAFRPEDLGMEYVNTIPGRGVTGSCPTLGDLDTFRRAGYRTLIDLRPRGEWQSPDWPDRVRAHGLEFVHFPVAGPADLTPELTAQFWKVWHDVGRHSLVAHCASGNRVGAALALAAARHGGHDVDSALEMGRSAGLTALEPAVRQMLDA